jgi:hypothetical protein
MTHPFSDAEARQPFLRALASVARGAHVRTELCREGAPQQTVAAVLADPPRRLAVSGAREGMELSLASLHACYIALFVGGFRGVLQRRFAVPAQLHFCALAVSPDGTALYATTAANHVLRICLATGRVLRDVAAADTDTHLPEFQGEVSVASDGLVYVADMNYRRVQVRTPDLEFLAYIDAGKLRNPWNICTTAEVVAVSSDVEYHFIRTAVLFRRSDGAELRRVKLWHAIHPSFCFWQNNLVSGDGYLPYVEVINLDGAALFSARHAPVQSIACSDAEELVSIGDCVRVYEAGVLRPRPVSRLCSPRQRHFGDCSPRQLDRVSLGLSAPVFFSVFVFTKHTVLSRDNSDRHPHLFVV